MKPAYFILVCDPGIGRADRLEMIPHAFDSTESANDFISTRTNPNVTRIVDIVQVKVADNFNLVTCKNS